MKTLTKKQKDDLISDAATDAIIRIARLDKKYGEDFDPRILTADDRAYVAVAALWAREKTDAAFARQGISAEDALKQCAEEILTQAGTISQLIDALEMARMQVLRLENGLPFLLWRTRRRLRAIANRILLFTGGRPSAEAEGRLLGAVMGHVQGN